MSRRPQSTRPKELPGLGWRGLCQKNPGANRAFSLLEVIGVLAVLAILATIIFSATSKSVNTAMGRQESATLRSFANALEMSILQNRFIPAPNGQSNWCQQIADQMGISSNAVMFNTRNVAVARTFLVDPNLHLGPGGTVTALPYSQDQQGPSLQQTNNCRAMIVSSLGAALPDTNSMEANFAQIWNTPDGTLPPGFSMDPDDLKIQRINLSTLFVRLVVTNLSAGAASYQIQSGSTNFGPLDNYFLRSTTVQLMDEFGVLQARAILDRDSAMFYVDQAWRDVPYPPMNVQTNPAEAGMAALMSAADVFFRSSPLNVNATGSTPASVSSLMTNFMGAYAAYGGTNAAFYTNALDAQTALENAMLDLIHNPACANP